MTDRPKTRVKPLVWEAWYFGDAFARTPFGVYNTREGEWRAPRKRNQWVKAENPRAAAEQDYVNRVLGLLE